MGYYSTINGDITFTRPASTEADASQAELERAKALIEQLGGQVALPSTGALSAKALDELQSAEKFNTINYFFAVNADGLTSVGEHDKAYELVSELHSMISLLRTDGVTANGTLEVHGENRGDIWRVVIIDNELREEHAKVTLTWPDGSTEKLI